MMWVAQVWEMDAPEVMMQLPVERSELPAHPVVRFNTPANLLALSTANKSIRILATAGGMQLLDSTTLSVVKGNRAPTVPSPSATGAGTTDPRPSPPSNVRVTLETKSTEQHLHIPFHHFTG